MDAPNPSATPTAASRTPLRIGAVGLIVRDLDRLADYYRNLLRLPARAQRAHGGSAPRRAAAGARTPAGRQARRRAQAGLYHTAFLMPTRERSRALDPAPRAKPHADHRRFRSRRERGDLSRRSGGQRHRGLQRSPAGALAARRRSDRDADRAARHRGDRARGRSATATYEGRRTDCASATSICASATSTRRRNSIAARVGLELTRRRGGATFMSSGGYHHHVGANVWHSAGAGRRDPERAGLAWFSMEAADSAALDGERQRVSWRQGAGRDNSPAASRPPIRGARACASLRLEHARPAAGRSRRAICRRAAR